MDLISPWVALLGSGTNPEWLPEGVDGWEGCAFVSFFGPVQEW